MSKKLWREIAFWTLVALSLVMLVTTGLYWGEIHSIEGMDQSWTHRAVVGFALAITAFLVLFVDEFIRIFNDKFKVNERTITLIRAAFFVIALILLIASFTVIYDNSHTIWKVKDINDSTYSLTKASYPGIWMANMVLFPSLAAISVGTAIVSHGADSE